MLKTYVDRPPYDSVPIKAVDGGEDLVPGTRIRHTWQDHCCGTVVARWRDEVGNRNITVLWSTPPIDVIPHFSGSVSMPLRQQVVSVQPMTMPRGSLFYMDYNYGSSSIGPSSSVGDPSAAQRENLGVGNTCQSDE